MVVPVIYSEGYLRYSPHPLLIPLYDICTSLMTPHGITTYHRILVPSTQYSVPSTKPSHTKNLLYAGSINHTFFTVVVQYNDIYGQSFFMNLSHPALGDQWLVLVGLTWGCSRLTNAPSNVVDLDHARKPTFWAMK